MDSLVLTNTLLIVLCVVAILTGAGQWRPR